MLAEGEQWEEVDLEPSTPGSRALRNMGQKAVQQMFKGKKVDSIAAKISGAKASSSQRRHPADHGVNNEGRTHWLSEPNQIPAIITAELNGAHYVSMVAVDWKSGLGAKAWQLHLLPAGDDKGQLAVSREQEPNHEHQEAIIPLEQRALPTTRVSVTVTEPWADVVGVVNITVYALPVASLEEKEASDSAETVKPKGTVGATQSLPGARKLSM